MHPAVASRLCLLCTSLLSLAGHCECVKLVLSSLHGSSACAPMQLLTGIYYVCADAVLAACWNLSPTPPHKSVLCTALIP